MTDQSVIWTALPDGRTEDGTALRLSVFVSPRLRPVGGDRLSLFPDFVAWPDAFAPDPNRFGVEFLAADGTPSGVAAEVVGDPPDPALWATLFPPDTFVRPHHPEHLADRAFATFPAERLHAFLKERYQRLGALTPWALPPDQVLATHGFGPLAELFGRVSTLGNQEFDGEAGRGFGVTLAADGVYVRNHEGRAPADPDSGDFAFSAVLAALEPETGVLRWLAAVPARIQEDVLAADGLVHIAQDWTTIGRGALRAFAAATGAERWRFPIGPEEYGARLLLGDTLYLTTDRGDEGVLRAFDAATGTPRWTYATPDRIIELAPTVGPRSTLYLTTEKRQDPFDRTLIALDAVTGEERGRVGLGGTPPLRVAGDTLVTMLDDQSLVGLDGTTLDRRWEAGFDGAMVIHGIENGAVFLSQGGPNAGGGLFAVDVETGDIRWFVEIVGTITSFQVVADRIYLGVFVRQVQSDLLVFDRETGDLVWGTVLPAPHVFPSVRVVGETVVVASSGAVSAIETADGTERWRLDAAPDGGFDDDSVTVAADDAAVFIVEFGGGGTPGASVVALDLADGAPRWRFGDGLLGATASIVGSRGELLYVLGEDLFAVDAATGAERWRFGTGRGGEDRALAPEVQRWADAADEASLSAVRAQVLAEAVGQANTRRAGRVTGQVIPEGGAPPIEVVPPSAGIGPQADAVRAMAFHHRPADVAPTPLPDPAALAAAVDFHQTLAALGDHPALLRRLGLVFDLTLPADAIPDLGDARSGRLRVVADWTPLLAPDGSTLVATPWTVYHRERFRPMIRGVDLGEAVISGPRELVPPDFHGRRRLALAQVDVDGGVLKALNTARSLAGRWQAPARPIDAPPESGAPALRSAGFAVLRPDHATLLNDNFTGAYNLDAQLQSDPSGQFDLTADDLTRGYRLDVWEERRGGWRSLHEREVTYALAGGGQAIPPVTDEGLFQPGVAEPAAPPADAAVPPELYVHDALTHWDGWSLSAPRPYGSLGEATLAPEPAADAPVTGTGLRISATVRPGSLPRLRFGERYRFRIRTVDLAGNSVPFAEAERLVDEADADPGQRMALAFPAAPVAYARFEPVAPPEVVLTAPLHEGEAVERVVLRSDHDATPVEYAARRPGETADRARHIAPPKIAQQLAEAHGRFDAALGTPRPDNPDDPLAPAVLDAYAIAKRDRGSFADGADPDPATKEPIRPEALLRLPYLPDPLSLGASLTNLPGAPSGAIGRAGGEATIAYGSPLPRDAAAIVGSVTRVDFGAGDGWWDPRPFRLRLEEATAPGTPPVWDGDGRVLTVALAKGERRSVRLASALDPAAVALLGQWGWTDEYETARIADPDALAARLETLRALAAVGLAWLLTPHRVLTLIHAVQRPVEEPKVLALEALTRDPGATSVDLLGLIRVHGASTAKLDLLATWSEPVDRPEDPAPGTMAGSAHVVEVPILLPGDDLAAPGAIAAEPGAAAVYQAAEDAVRFLPGAGTGGGRRPRHEFGDTKHRRVRYRSLATSRFREFMPEEIAADPDQLSRASAEVELVIPSSARPAAPRLRYVLPAFAWERPDGAADGAAVPGTRRRRGGVRILLDRPWHSSGEGELLAVVCRPHDPPPPSNLPLRATVWGDDPIWNARASDARAAGPRPAMPGPTAFGRAVAIAEGLIVADDPTSPVDVAGHEVWFDDRPGRGLWACDVAVDAGPGYFPFLRLALARYQPHALPGAELSEVVIADLVQVAPERTVTLITEPDNPDVVDLAVLGFATGDTAGPVGLPEPRGDRERIDVALERRIPGTTGELGWVPVRVPDITRDDGFPEDADAGQLLWAGRITLPAGRASNRFRLVVREYEHFAADARETGGYRTTRRVVFAETIAL